MEAHHIAAAVGWGDPHGNEDDDLDAIVMMGETGATMKRLPG